MRRRDDDRDRGGPPLPKPYVFVPLPEGRIPTAPPAGHHRYAPDRYTGTLSATLLARSPVHVASGLLTQTGDRRHPLVKAQFRSGGVPTIPATSIKGCIRSIVEAISRSAVQVTKAREVPRPSSTPDKLDIAQRIFGAMGYGGLLGFSDAPLTAGETQIVPSVQLFRPRPESYGGVPGRKFYQHGELARGDLPLEACPAGSSFALRMHFENLSATELGLVLVGLGLGEPRFCPKLGGGKPACLGTVEIAAPALTALPARDAYADLDAQPQPLDAQPLIAAAHSAGLVLDEQLHQLAHALRWPREDDRACPDRMY